jgi:hypothetical protein
MVNVLHFRHQVCTSVYCTSTPSVHLMINAKKRSTNWSQFDVRGHVRRMVFAKYSEDSRMAALWLYAISICGPGKSQ